MSGHLSYGLQSPKALIGTPTTPVTLTNAYTGNTYSLITSGAAMITFYLQYTAQTGGNTVQLKIESSPNTTNDIDAAGNPVTPLFYQDVSTAVAAGVVTLAPIEYTFTNAGTTAKLIRILWPCADQEVKISLKETINAGTAGTASLAALVGCND
jgi:hypothetical protein